MFLRKELEIQMVISGRACSTNLKGFPLRFIKGPQARLIGCYALRGSSHMAHRYTTQIASDIVRDGIGVELLCEKGSVVAEVFRSDRDQTLLLNTFSFDIPLEAIEAMISVARERLGPFEDGTDISKAKLIAPQLLVPAKEGSGQ